MPTETIVNNLIINKLTKAQYDAITTKSDTELYLVPDEIDTTPTSGSDNCVTSGGVYTALANKVDTSDLATVATSGSYNDLSNKPTNVGDFTNDAGYLTNTDLPTNHVTTDTTLNITGEKTFVGNKKLKFKQSAGTDKLGFTAYNTSNVECGNFEVLPNDKAVNLGIYAPDTTPNKDWIVGFKYQAKDSGGTVHKFGLRVPPRFGTSTYTEYYIPTTINGLTADNTGNITIPTPVDELSSGYEMSSDSNEDLALAPGDTYEEAFGKLEKATIDNEYVVTSALNDLNNRVNDVTYSSTNKLSADLIEDGTTNKAYTATEQTKLSGIAAGAEVNVLANWNESDSSSDAYILNKPTIPTVTFRLWTTT